MEGFAPWTCWGTGWSHTSCLSRNQTLATALNQSENAFTLCIVIPPMKCLLKIRNNVYVILHFLCRLCLFHNVYCIVYFINLCISLMLHHFVIYYILWAILLTNKDYYYQHNFIQNKLNEEKKQTNKTFFHFMK